MEAILRRALILRNLWSRPLACALFLSAVLHADNGHDAWLRYAPQPDFTPTVIATVNNSLVTNTARGELIRGLGRKMRIVSGIPREDAIVLGTLDELPPE